MYCPSKWSDSTVTATKKIKITYNNDHKEKPNILDTIVASTMILYLLISDKIPDA